MNGNEWRRWRYLVRELSSQTQMTARTLTKTKSLKHSWAGVVKFCKTSLTRCLPVELKWSDHVFLFLMCRQWCHEALDENANDQFSQKENYAAKPEAPSCLEQKAKWYEMLPFCHKRRHVYRCHRFVSTTNEHCNYQALGFVNWNNSICHEVSNLLSSSAVASIFLIVWMNFDKMYTSPVALKNFCLRITSKTYKTAIPNDNLEFWVKRSSSYSIHMVYIRNA